MKRVLAVAAVIAATAIAAAAPKTVTLGFQPLDVRTVPIPRFKLSTDEKRFGALEYRGGFAMYSTNADFGSWSGLDFMSDGRIVAIADTGFWLTARLVEDGDRLTDIAEPRIGIMLADNGQPAPNKVSTDAEGLRIIHVDGREIALVSFEQKAAVRRYAGPDFASAVPKNPPLPRFVSGLRRNQGLESVAVAPTESPLAGATIAIAERSLDDKGNHRGFILDGPKAGQFTIRRSDDFDVSDANFLPNGDLLILERRFSFTGGFAMRIREIPAATIKPGALVDGIALITADSTYQIDNMEGLAVRSGPSGEVLLDLISDDNHGFLQRSILLQFALLPQK
ncbi:MAG TPA: esterase-like activity of phytase family protein [Bauldia sp.]|nr:esterase-like activity of phytase family protein [Bauldia sp.]